MDNYLKYKDYKGSVSFSAEDGVFYGKVEGINDLVSFEGRTVSQLKSAFRESVKDYLRTCAELGKTPDKSYKGSLNVRLTPDIHKKAALFAASKQVSLNEFIKRALDFALRHEKELDRYFSKG